MYIYFLFHNILLMDESAPNFKHKRKPVVAVILSFIVIGLGYVYCGRIVRGLLIFFIFVILIPFATFAIEAASPRINMTVIGVSLLISLLIWIAAIIDSYRIAKHTKPDYELKDYNRWYVYLFFYLLITTYTNQFALGIKSNLMEAFRTSSSSMYPTLESHDCFLANKKAYKNYDPNRDDVIVFTQPEDRKVYYVQRVVAVAGDTIEMKDNQLIINGETLEKAQLYTATYVGKDANNNDVNVGGIIFSENYGQTEYQIFLMDTYGSIKSKKWSLDFPETKIPKNHCFVLGDNRNLSRDSRDFGPIPLSTVKGRAEYLYWPAKDWSRFGEIK